MDERNVEVTAEQLDDVACLVLPHQAMIDEDAGQLLADGFMDEDRSDGGIDTAGEAANHPALADLVANAVDRLLAEGGHRPVARQSGDLVHEIGEKFCTIRRVGDLEMELRRVEFSPLVGDRGKGRILGNADDLEAGRKRGDAIAVAHPDLMALARFPDAVEERRRL
jgi:hypothetical protein